MFENLTWVRSDPFEPGRPDVLYVGSNPEAVVFCAKHVCQSNEERIAYLREVLFWFYDPGNRERIEKERERLSNIYAHKFLWKVSTFPSGTPMATILADEPRPVAFPKLVEGLITEAEAGIKAERQPEAPAVPGKKIVGIDPRDIKPDQLYTFRNAGILLGFGHQKDPGKYVREHLCGEMGMPREGKKIRGKTLLNYLKNTPSKE